MNTTQRCPGNELNKSLQTYKCKCPECGKENEFFSDELNKSHKCVGCGVTVEMTSCTPDGQA